MELKFIEVVKMFDELKKRGYTTEEIMTMPITVGNK